MLLLLIGVLLVSLNIDELKTGKVSLVSGVKHSFCAAVLFGFFWPLNQYIVQHTDWLAANVVTKLVAVMIVFLLFVVQHRSFIIPKQTRNKKVLLPVVAVGILEGIAVLSVSGGLSIGNAIIITPISSSLTVVTVGLAMLFLKEKNYPEPRARYLYYRYWDCIDGNWWLICFACISFFV